MGGYIPVNLVHCAEQIDETCGNPKQKKDHLECHPGSYEMIEEIADAISNTDASWEHNSNGEEISEILVPGSRHVS